MKLKKVNLITIKPTKPFDFDFTFYKPDHFPSPDTFYIKGVRWQTFRWLNKCLGLKFQNVGTKINPKINVYVYYSKKLASDFIKSLENEIIYRYNLNLDLTDFYRNFKKDKTLGPIIKQMRGMRPGHQNSLYEYLIIGIVLQNATVKRSVQMLQNLLKKYGVLLEYDGKKLFCFWQPGRLKGVKEEDLRALKVGYRAKSIKRTDDQFIKGNINEDDLRGRDIKTQMNTLLKLYGVGPATVWYLLFDIFHHYDFFNHISPWEQKIYSKVFFDRDPEKPISTKKLIKYFDKFGKYKQLAVHYIWEDLWWKRKNKHVEWLEKLIRL